MQASARRPGRRTGLERRLDGVGDEPGGPGVDSDVAVEQHAADDVAGVQGRILRAVGQVSAPCRGSVPVTDPGVPGLEGDFLGSQAGNSDGTLAS
jgi:hypothetical protein